MMQSSALVSTHARVSEPHRVVIHPLTIRSPLAVDPAVGDYQVRVAPDQTIELDIVPVAAEIDLARIEARVSASINRAGARARGVRARTVDQLQRDPRTGKTPRFLTVPATSLE